MRLANTAALGLALMLVAGPVTGQGREQTEEQPLVSAIAASLEIRVAGRVLDRPLEPREPALLSLSLQDRVTGLPARLDEARALIRHMSDGSEPCRDMTYKLRATGMATSGDYPLNGSLILTISADRHVALVDPLLPAARNTLAIRALPLAEPRLVSDPGSNVFAVQDGVSGRALRIDLPDLALAPLAGVPDGYLHLDTAGLTLVGQDQILRLGRAGPTRSLALPAGGWRLERRGQTALFRNAAGDRRMVMPRSRAERFRTFALPPAAGALAASVDGTLAIYATGATLHLVNTATGRIADVPVGRPPRAAYISPDGAAVLVVLDDELTVAIVESAGARLAGAITLQSPLADIAMTESDGFLQLVNAGMLRFPLAALRRGEGLVLSPAAEPRQELRERRAPWLPALTVMAQGEGVLASGFQADSIARIEAQGHAAFNAPQPPPTPIRAGAVKAISAVARGFAEAGPGRYTAPFVARASGPHVLVLADRLGKISACAAFHVGSRESVPARPRTLRLRVDSARSHLAAGEDTLLALATDTPLPEDAPERLQFEVMDMASPWRTQALAKKVDGGYRLVLRFPHSGRFIAQPLAGPPFDGSIAIRMPEKPEAGQ